MDFVTESSAERIHFRLPDSQHAAASVRLWLDLEHNVESPPMTPVGDGWELEVPRPPVQRLEYLFTVRYGDGSESMLTDPTNPCRVATVFGDHSVIEFPGYRRPDWLEADAPAFDRSGLIVRAPGLHRPMPITVCGPAGLDPHFPLPVLLVQDGPEFDALAAISRFSAVMIASGRLPAHRIALLAPGDRNRWYAALPAYSSALRNAVLPAIRNNFGVVGPVVLTGASLGGVAALHAAWTQPGMLGGLFLQSGSFFRPHLDAHESSFSGYDAIVAFVESLDDVRALRPLRIGMTCGLGEENLANNRQMFEVLRRDGEEVTLAELPDAHTYVAWRDALDPHLTRLLAEVWADAA